MRLRSTEQCTSILSTLQMEEIDTLMRKALVFVIEANEANALPVNERMAKDLMGSILLLVSFNKLSSNVESNNLVKVMVKLLQSSLNAPTIFLTSLRCLTLLAQNRGRFVTTKLLNPLTDFSYFRRPRRVSIFSHQWGKCDCDRCFTLFADAVLPHQNSTIATSSLHSERQALPHTNQD